MSDKIRIGMIWLGARGAGLLEMVYIQHPDVEFSAVCDVYRDRCEKAADIIEKSGRKKPVITDNYRDVLAMPDVDAVILCICVSKPWRLENRLDARWEERILSVNAGDWWRLMKEQRFRL